MVSRRMYLSALAVILCCEFTMRQVIVSVGWTGGYLLIALPISVAVCVLAGKWTMGAVARREGKRYRPDPVERFVMRRQLRRQERQLR